jgi:formyltetrahydrofolate deformylase
MADTDTPDSRNSVIALVSCPLQRGVAASMTQFVYELGTDIIEHRQYVDTDQNHLFARLEWQVDPPNIPRDTIKDNFREKLAEPFGMQWSLHFSADPFRMAVFVTKGDLEKCRPWHFSSRKSEKRGLHFPSFSITCRD